MKFDDVGADDLLRQFAWTERRQSEPLIRTDAVLLVILSTLRDIREMLASGEITVETK